MLSKFFNFICICSFIYLCLNIIYLNNLDNNINNNINKNIDLSDKCIKTIDYKIKHKIENSNINDKFNIKEYNEINTNILIHNQYKNELNGYINKKNIDNYYNDKIKNEKQKQINDNINKNSNIILYYNLKEKYMNVLEFIKSFTISFKLDINNLLNDIKKNNLNKSEKINIYNSLLTIINNTKEEINIISSTNLSYDDKNNDKNNDKFKIPQIKEKYIKLLNIKLNLLNKKEIIYNKILLI